MKIIYFIIIIIINYWFECWLQNSWDAITYAWITWYGLHWIILWLNWILSILNWVDTKNWTVNPMYFTVTSCEHNIKSELILKCMVVGTSIENSVFYRSECKNINNTNDNWPCHQSRFAWRLESESIFLIPIPSQKVKINKILGTCNYNKLDISFVCTWLYFATFE